MGKAVTLGYQSVGVREDDNSSLYIEKLPIGWVWIIYGPRGVDPVWGWTLKRHLAEHRALLNLRSRGSKIDRSHWDDRETYFGN